MSVIGTYARLGERDLERLRSDPEWMDALYRGRVASAEIVDVDKACDGLVWLLSRLPPSPSPQVEGAGFVLQRSLAPLLSGQGGREESALDAPYGPAHSLQAEQVAQLNAWLADVSLERLREEYDPRAMAKEHVYPQIWVQEGAAALEEYVLPHLERLRQFFRRAAEESQVVVVFFA
jgi:hypothetical protein